MAPSDQSIVCPGCTCLCDDVLIESADSLSVINACERGVAWIEEGIANADQPVTHRLNGKTADLESVTAAAADRLLAANAPLICGLDKLDMNAQQAAWKLADLVGATIDSSLHNDGRASMFSLQKHGKVSATLGEISSRSDLVVFWFCDPVTTHPRHLERYSRPAAGPARKIIVVDEAQTATAAVADQFIRLSKSNAAAMLMALRASMAGIVLNASQVEPTTGHAQERIDGLADQLKSARYGAFVYGHTTQDSAFDLASDQLAQLTRELNQHTRFVSLGLRSDANARSAENVIAWSSGYPFAVNYAQSIPRFNRLEHSAAVLLERGECDLIVAGPGIEKDVQSLSPKARKHFQATAKIMLTSAASEADAAIVLHVAAAGIDSEGDFCRQDDVALPLTKLVATERPSAVEAIEQILAHVRPRVLA